MTRGQTLRPFYWRATTLFPEQEIVSRTRGGRTRHDYAAFGDRVARLAGALRDLGVEPGDRVGTFGWNTHRHMEAYYAPPLLGAQLHTINVVLPDDDVEFIVGDAADDVLLVDPGEPFETVERLFERFDSVEHVVVMDEEAPESDLPVRAYDELLVGADPVEEWPDVDPDAPAGMCYTSGTTGTPKGVEYTQAMMHAHAMMVQTPSAIGIGQSDVVMHVVPMYHVNSWNFPYAATVAGAKQVYPGPSPDTETLASLVESEGVTLTAGVPTVFIDLLEYADRNDVDFSSLERIVVGGSAAPKGVMRRYAEEYDVTVDHAWGMTETMSIASISRPKRGMDLDGDGELDLRAKQGLLSPGLEMSVVDDDGEDVPWDGESFGELRVRGPTVVDEYYDRPEATEESFEDGWLRTGDIATVDEEGYFEIVDRAKDVIKSGGEWISSIRLENALMEHDDVVQAAVVAVPHDRWRERPVAAVVTSGAVDEGELRDHLSGSFPRWWLPDDVHVRESIPKTATGKFDKKALRKELADAPTPHAPEEY
ncbi:long-chain fatty acid--CoA ligase [Halorarum salinum]|uniref:Long-chain fatty acid--CoA ligase n=1 Tax=Halorarum salinum TaxID=2743089 RepID=A0A7D5LAV2_9EURY|nr:long-chain fatty acid--CoA ligase [Halobaculum salinum]QLG62353.1 long-chain fatty acid--CoA ligase [Halobaculum salinum]